MEYIQWIFVVYCVWFVAWFLLKSIELNKGRPTIHWTTHHGELDPVQAGCTL